jgi:hypothetical protein
MTRTRFLLFFAAGVWLAAGAFACASWFDSDLVPVPPPKDSGAVVPDTGPPGNDTGTDAPVVDTGTDSGGVDSGSDAPRDTGGADREDAGTADVVDAGDAE